MNINLEAAVKRIAVHGPDRVIMDHSGYAVPPSIAAYRHVSWDMIFIRDDGWSLATNADNQKYAFRLWKDHWTHVMTFRNVEGNKPMVYPISEYCSD